MDRFRRQAKRQPHFPDLAQLAGNYRGFSAGLECWEIRNLDEEPFNHILEAVRREVSGCQSIPRSTLILIDIFLRGRTLESSAAHVMLAGTTPRHRSTAVRHLRRSASLRKYPWVKVDQWAWPPQASDVTTDEDLPEYPDENIFYTYPNDDIRSSVSGLASGEGGRLSPAGSLSCLVRVGHDDFQFAPAHRFAPLLPGNLDPVEDTYLEDSDSERGSETQGTRRDWTPPEEVGTNHNTFPWMTLVTSGASLLLLVLKHCT